MKQLIVAVLAAFCIVTCAAAAPTGPYAVKMEADPGLKYHTLFHPADMARAGKLPVIVFAGGGCRNAGARFGQLLGEVASHGYFVISLGEIGDPAHDMILGNKPVYSGRPTTTDVSQIDWAIDWAKAQTGKRGGRFAGKLDMSRLALMGQSCGGTQSIDRAAAHPEIKTLVALNTGLFPNDLQMGGSTIKRAELGKIHVPVIILLGGKGDVAYDNGQANFDLMVNAPAIVASADYGHTATWFEPNGGLYATVVTRWLAWQLQGDRAARATFVGADCTLCIDKKWTVRQRGLDALK